MSEQTTSDRLIRAATTEPLSKVLPVALSAARQVGDEDLAHWLRLEISGYWDENPSMTADVVVPEYRTVPGRHIDRHQGPIEIRDDRLRFLNTDRLRYGVGTLEELAHRDDAIQVDHSTGMSFLRDDFKADPVAFVFSPNSVTEILNAIRSRLIDELEDRRDLIDKVSLPSAEVPGEKSWASVAAFLGRSVWRVVLLTIGGTLAGLLVAYLVWQWGWK